jgi:hypothetical protein
MEQKKAYVELIARYLARGAVGVSVGFAAVAPVSAKPTADTNATARSFAERLAAIRAAVSDHVNRPFDIAQIIPRPPPPPPKPFFNVFGKAPFSDAFRNVPPPPPK